MATSTNNCFEYKSKGNNHWSNYTQSSRNIRLKDKHILEAECRKINGEYVVSTIDLNLILGNDHGKFGPGAWSLDIPVSKYTITAKYDSKSIVPGKYKSPQEIQLLDDGKTLSARLLGQDRTPVALYTFDTAYANLDSFLGNNDGRLVCGFVREGGCKVCNSFPLRQKAVEAKELTGQLKWADCPSCKILDDLFQSLQERGFRRENTRIKCIRSDITDLPQISFECKGDGGEDLQEHFEMYRVKEEETSTYQFAQSFVPESRHLTNGSDTRECLSLVRGWIEECSATHERCEHERQLRAEDAHSSNLPSRVLDIGNAEGDPIRLSETKGSSEKYICLSHSWGGSQTLTLTTANYATLLEEVPQCALQNVYSDAVAFCRRLSVRYIWIDTLCIVQDDANDWEVESAKMESYYGRCYVCLAATNARSHDGRCSTSPSRQRFTGNGVDGSPYSIHIRPVTAHIPDGEHSERFPLLTRAWVYQERRLSPRVLHFFRNEVFFECASMGVCECGKRQKFTLYERNSCWTKNRETYIAGHNLLSDINGAEDKKEHIKQEWHAFVNGYSALDLTNPKDRLPALAGLAKLTRKRREAAHIPTGRYLAGLWEEQLASDMAWSVGKALSRYHKEVWEEKMRPDEKFFQTRPISAWYQAHEYGAKYRKSRGHASQSAPVTLRPRPETFIAPSWSWAGVFEVINFAPFEYTKTLCKILQADVKLAGTNLYGQVKNGTLVIQAHLLVSSLEYKNEWNNGKKKHWLKDIPCRSDLPYQRHNDGMVFWPDYDFEAPGRGKVDLSEKLYLMPLVARNILGRDADAEFRWKWWPGTTFVETVYLVLRRAVASSVPVFERIGWTYHITRRSAADFHTSAKEIKFMLV